MTNGLVLSEHPDVILMDLEMPVHDRWEVVRRLKKDAQTGHTRSSAALKIGTSTSAGCR